MDPGKFEALLAALEYRKPVFEYDIAFVEGPGGVYGFEYISNWDEILTVGNVLKLANGQVILIGHRCEMGGVGQNHSIARREDDIEGVAHISQLFKEDVT